MTYCKSCRKAFENEAALKQHVDMSAAHCRSRHPNAQEIGCPDVIITNQAVDTLPQVYEGDEPVFVNAVYRFALQRRRALPTVGKAMEMTGTPLRSDAVSSLMVAAERLNSIAESPDDAVRRAESQRLKSKMAQLHEDAFVEQLALKGCCFIRELEQRNNSSSLGLVGQGTPDVRFTEKIVVQGHVCG